MKKLLSSLSVVLMSLSLISPAFASDGAGIGKIAIHISDPVHRNTYFLCVADFGCFSILGGEAHKAIPTVTGTVDAMFATDVFTRRIYPQQMPASCRVQLHNKQTLEIYGKLDANSSSVTIHGLHCRVG